MFRDRWGVGLRRVDPTVTGGLGVVSREGAWRGGQGRAARSGAACSCAGGRWGRTCRKGPMTQSRSPVNPSVASAEPPRPLGRCRGALFSCEDPFLPIRSRRRLCPWAEQGGEGLGLRSARTTRPPSVCGVGPGSRIPPREWGLGSRGFRPGHRRSRRGGRRPRAVWAPALPGPRRCNWAAHTRTHAHTRVASPDTFIVLGVPTALPLMPGAGLHDCPGLADTLAPRLCGQPAEGLVVRRGRGAETDDPSPATGPPNGPEPSHRGPPWPHWPLSPSSPVMASSCHRKHCPDRLGRGWRLPAPRP